MAGAFVLLAAVLAVLFVAGAHASSRLLRDGQPSVHAGVQEPAGRTAADPPVTDATDIADRPEKSIPADSRTDPQLIEFTAPTLFVNALVSHGVLGLILLAGIGYYGVPLAWLGVVPSSVNFTLAIGGLLFGAVLWFSDELAASIVDTAGFAYDETLRAALAPDSRWGWVVLLGLVLPVVAAVEELLFRAALIGVPATAFGISPWIFAVISSVAFGLGHGAQGRAGMVVTGLLGLGLAAGYVISGSLLVVIVAHYMVNATEFVVHEWQ